MTEFTITGGNDELLSIAQAHRGDIILVDFYADWCDPFKAIAPHAHALVKKYASKAGFRRVVLCKVNVEEEGNEDLCQAYQIRAMPTFVWISNTNVVHRMEGADRSQLESKTAELCAPRS
jgi:thioredoxin 1